MRRAAGTGLVRILNRHLYGLPLVPITLQLNLEQPHCQLHRSGLSFLIGKTSPSAGGVCNRKGPFRISTSYRPWRNSNDWGVGGDTNSEPTMCQVLGRQETQTLPSDTIT